MEKRKIFILFILVLFPSAKPESISISDLIYDLAYMFYEADMISKMGIFDQNSQKMEIQKANQVLGDLLLLYLNYKTSPPVPVKQNKVSGIVYYVISNKSISEGIGDIPDSIPTVSVPEDAPDLCQDPVVYYAPNDIFYAVCDFEDYIVTFSKGIQRSKRSLQDDMASVNLNDSTVNFTFPNGSLVLEHAKDLVHDIVTRKDCIKMEKTCPIPRRSLSELSKCGFMTCRNMSCLDEVFVNSTAICKNLVHLIYLTTVDKTYLQPATQHMFDNNPHKRALALYKFPSPVTPVNKVRETVYMDCNGSLSSSGNPQVCYSMMHGDVNAVYKTFGSFKDTGTHNIIISTESIFNCEYSDPVWKDILLLPAMAGHPDTTLFTAGLTDSPGFKKGQDCFIQICDLCIKQVPFVLAGSCEVSNHIRDGSHFVRMCNKDSHPIGYVIRPVHSAPRITDDYEVPSRFILIDIYNYFHKKVVGSNPRLVGDNMQDSLIKGRITEKNCVDQVVSGSDSEWIYYYLKCGATLHHHNEYLNLEKRCNLKYGDWKLPTVMQWICRYWNYIRNIIIALLLIITTYIFHAVYISYYMLGFICIIISPITYLIHNNYPKMLRCKSCDGPWMPWHSCPETCPCGHPYSKDHKENCDFYSSTPLISNNQDDFPLPGDPGYLEYIANGIGDYRKKYKNHKKSKKNSSNTKVDIESGIISKKAYFSFRNPYSRPLSAFILVTIFYVCLCFMIQPALACERCTENCHFHNGQYTVECEGRSHSCICLIKVACHEDNMIYSSFSTGSGNTESEHLYSVPGCLKIDMIDEESKVTALVSSMLKEHPCFTVSRGDTNFLHYVTTIATGLPTINRISLIKNRTVEDCSDFKKEIEASSGYKTRVDQMVFSPSIRRIGVDISGSLNINSLSLVKVGEKEFIQALNTSAFSDESQNMIMPIRDAVKEKVDEENMRKRGELLQDFLHIINLLKYNGSIFGRDHSINYPDPPSTIQHVYATVETDQHTTLDITVPAVAGRSASFRPIVSGIEIPITFTISIPEVAGVYDMLYSYTTCRTGSIDVIRFDKCVGSCTDCFDILKSTVRQTNKDHWKETQKHERISFESPNTWGCEGQGCWTVGTGCLCSYCANIPDPNDCYDVYNIRYRYSKALYCLSINEEHQCEHVRLGQTINRSGKVQIELQGSDEWASSVKSEHVAIHRNTGDIRMGSISALGESTGNFGNPQYNYNLSVVFKEQDIESHYVCKVGEDQDVFVGSCFKDTWSMLQTLERAPAYFMDSGRKLLYHVGSTVGTIRTVLEIPKGKLMWITEPLKVQISSVQCFGCYRCLSGSLCSAKIESSHTGFVYIGFSPGTPRMATLNLLRGLHTYNMTVDFDNKASYPTLFIMDGNRVTLAEKKVTTLLKNGNAPRNTVRNSTNTQRDIFGRSSNSFSSVGNFLSSANPIKVLSGLFSSAWVHYLLSFFIWGMGIFIIVYIMIYLARWSFAIAIKKLATTPKKTV